MAMLNNQRVMVFDYVRQTHIGKSQEFLSRN